jgi:hypothetical protein
MASEFLISPLSLDEQAAVLSEFLKAKRRVLPIEQAASICVGLGLATGGQKTDLAKKLAAELLRRSLKVNHASCVEAVAKLCGGENWMRLRQTLLTSPSGSSENAIYAVHVTATGEDGDGRVFPHASFGAAATFILEFLREAWPSETVPSLCNFEVRPHLVSLDFEHPTATWMTVRVMKFEDSEDTSEPSQLSDEEVRIFCGRIQRALEFSHPGLLVMGAERSATLSSTHILLPRLQQPATGFNYVCQATMELYLWLGSFDLGYPDEYGAPGVLSTPTGPVLFAPRWVNGINGVESYEDTDSSVAVDLAKRLLRIRQVTRSNMTEFFSAIASGAGREAGAYQFNRLRLIEKMEATGLSVMDVVTTSGLTLNDVLRARKYGHASAELLQKLADAVGFESPNELLADDEEPSIGIRIEDGQTFLLGLKNSQQWRIVIGNSLDEEELESAQGIAESLKEYVDLYQFANSDWAPPAADEPPLDDATMAGHIQVLLDELHRLGLVALVGRGLRYIKVPGEAKGTPPMAMQTSTLCIERESHLQKPVGFKNAA